MADPHLDHPGEVQWWSGQAPAAVLGPCPHECPHNLQAVIAHGPDFRRYELVRCDVASGCDGQCRAWCASRGGHSSTPWLMVKVPAQAKVR
jgi:hypothetical protein